MSRARSASHWRIVLALLLPSAACARAMPPPGGDEDRDAPRVIETVPAPLAIEPDFSGDVIFRFDERISERGVDNNAVLVSPRTGAVKVSRGRSDLRVSVEGGWRPGTVYRVILLPGIRDLFNNELREPAELAFSTGGDLAATVIGGLISDRITGQPVPLAIVEATPRGDSTVYVTGADSLAFFSFRYLAPAVYDIVAYADQNRNRRQDPAEAYSRRIGVPVNRDTDTILVENVAIVPADTTPPRLLRAEPADSTSVRLATDDWLEPTADLQFMEVTLLTLPDSVPVPGEHRLITVDSFAAMQERLRAEQAEADSVAGDSVPRMTPPAAAGRGLGPGRPGVPRPPVASSIPAPTLPLPYQEFVLIPASPLTPGQRYAVTVQGLANISARSGGGGTVMFEVPARAPPRPDTTRAVRPAPAQPAPPGANHGRRPPRHPIR